MKAATTVCSLIGLTMLVGSLWWYRATVRRLRGAIAVTGRCVGLKASSSGKGGTTYRPIVEFVGPSGPVRFTSNVGSSDPEFAVGDAVPVSYLASDPHRALVATYADVVGGPLFVAWFGIFFLGAGLLVTFVLGDTRRFVP